MSVKESFEKSAENKEEKVQQFDMYGVKVNVVPSEKQFAQEIFDSLAAIPTGRTAIEDMKKYKVDFYLETALGTAGGYFDPLKNRIVMAKSVGRDFMEFALVHEARHLLQNNLGRDMAEAKNLDYASRLMINRATEADAQAQALKACKEWEAIGHDAPLKRFTGRYKPIVDAYNKNNSLSDAFKGWYDDKRICSRYEQYYDVETALTYIAEEQDDRKPVSLKPADVAKFCGGDRVEGFEDFLNSKQARQVHLLTKTVLELANEAAMTKGAPRDPSLASVPTRDLEGDFGTQFYALKNAKETRKNFNPESVPPKETVKKEMLKIAMNAVDAVEKINKAAIMKTRDPEAEKALKEAKKQIASDAVYKAARDARRTAQIAAMKNGKER